MYYKINTIMQNIRLKSSLSEIKDNCLQKLKILIITIVII